MNTKNVLLTWITVLLLFTGKVSSQTCPAIAALAGSATTTNICQGSCVTLSTNLVPVNATTSYSFGSIAYTGFPYVGGTAVIPAVDDIWSGVVNIGFPFCYFGNTFNQLLVGSNGQITFSTSLANQGEAWQINNIMPNLINTPGNSINGVFRDIDPSVGGAVRIYTTGIAPCRKFVAYWLNVPLFGCPAVTASTFQIVLHETTNIIDINIVNSSGACTSNNGRGLVGVQNNNATLGFAPATRNNLTNWTATNETWRFTPTGVPTYTINWSGPSFSATGNTATVCPTASGNYTAVMSIARCGGGPNIIRTSTAQINVTATPTVSAFNLNGTICSGSQATLVATGALSYTWFPGNLVSNTVAVSPTITTTYTVIGSVGSCTNAATVTLPVSNSPTVTVISTPTSLCSGSGGSATLAASGAISYTWFPGVVVSSSLVITPLTTTSYSVVGSNSIGCTGTTNITYSVLPTPTVNASSSSTNICAGNSATLTATGATTYTWNPGSLIGSNVVVSPIVNTIYTVSGQNGNCIGTRTIAITVSPNPTIIASGSPTLLCNGNSSTLTASGATTYTWNPGNINGSSVVVTPNATTNYTVRGTSGSCTAQAIVSVSVNPTPTLNPIATPTAICFGNTATLSSTGATSFTWNPGNLSGSSVTVSPSSTTIYTVTGTTNSCTSTRTLALTVNPNPTVTAIASPTVICAGAQTTLTAGGATNYTWNPGNLTGANVVVSPSVNTTYTVVGANGNCTSSALVSVSVNPSPTVTAIASPTSICAGTGATSTLTASGALSYTWNPGNLSGSSVTVSPVSTTIYTLSGSNAAGCTSTVLTTVSVVPVPTINATASATTICAGNSTTLSATGATSYTWNPGNLTGSIVVVTPVSNTIYTVTGSNGACTSTAVISISVNPSPTITASSSPTIICSGNTATLAASGATTYTWNPGNLSGSTVTVSPNNSTTYTVTGTAGTCTSQALVTLFVNPTPTVVPAASPATICAGNTSTLSATGAGSFTWNPGNLSGSSVTVSPASTTIYTLSGSIANCVSTTTLLLTVNPNPTVTAIASPTVICAGAQTTLTAGGATNYTWNPGNLTGANVVVSPSVNTTYTVVGANGSCTNSAIVSVSVSPQPTIVANATPTNICSSTGGSATLTATGAVSYIWNPGSFFGGTVVVTPTATTSYTVIGSSSAGCLSATVVTVQITPTPTLNINATNTAICAGNTTTITVTGATNYTWNPGSLTGSLIAVNPASTTIYTVTGANGICTSTGTISITVNPNPTVTASSSNSVVCSGATVTLSAFGATGYTWNPGNIIGSTATVAPVSTTIYTVSGSSGSCTATSTIQIIVNPSPTVIAISNPTAVCAGGSATLSASGSSTYTWNPGNLNGSSVVVTPSVSGIYTVIGTSSLGCTSSGTVSLIVNPNPTITASASPSNICSGNSSTIIASGGTSYTWNPGSVISPSVIVSPTATTVYTVIGSNGTCTGSAVQTVSVLPSPGIMAAIPGPSTICSGGNTQIVISGVVSATWQPNNITGLSALVSPTATTIYTITGSNAFGCSASTTIQVNLIPTPTVNVSASSTSVCAGSNVTLTATGASSFVWQPGSLSGSTVVVNPTSTTIYTAVGSTSICSSSNTIQIFVTPLPSVTAVSSPTAICRNSSATLTVSGATSYTWLPSLSNATSIVVSPTVTTSYTVIGANGLCTNSAVVSVSVLPTPNINTFANPVNVCSGNSSTLVAIGAQSYTWNPGSVVSQTIVVTPSVTTVYTVTGTNAFGCSNTATRVVNVIPSPTVNLTASPATLCVGGSSTLTASGANFYLWTPGPLTGSQVVVSPTVTTTYTVTGNIGLCTNTQTFEVNVLPTPTLTVSASNTLVCAAEAVTLSVIGAGSYTWNPGAFTNSVYIVNPLVNTVYTVTGSNSGSCTVTETIAVDVSPGPTITIAATNTSVCAGNSVVITPTGATTYTLLPGLQSGSSFTVSPASTITYTILGSDLVGCAGVATLEIIVNPIPTISITPSTNGICIGNTVTLTATGADTYTWLPSASTGSVFTDSPITTTVYTVVGTSNAGCASTATISIGVTPEPTVTAFSSSTVVCQSGSLTLTSSGATNYTWNPGAISGGTVVVNPTVTTTYTVEGDNGGCSSTATVEILVTPGPQDVTASSTGSITCVVSTVGLNGSTTSTNVAYFWNGPVSFTSNIQNPSPVSVGGTYTLTVTDLNTGCSISATTAVISNTAVPDFSVTSSGDLGCNDFVTLSASSSASAGITYTWSGPATFTSASQSFTTNVAGEYTVSAFDISSGCVSSLTVAVNSNTDLPVFTATILPATCNGTVSNNDGTILVSGNGVRFDLVTGSSYTGTATYTTATPIPTTGIITNTLVNPSVITPYTIRIYGSNGCFKDTTLNLIPINCDNRVFGLTKAAGTPSLVNNLYQISYTVTAINADISNNLTNVTLNENLNSTFPLPSTYTVVGTPVITSQGSSLTINPLFDGSTEISLTTASLSILPPSKRDTIVFTVQIDPKGFFGPFVNSVIGFANDVNSLSVSDSSNDGFAWDPDSDGNPTNNNIPTVVNLIPNSRIGIAKAAVVSTMLPDNTYDVTYIVTVKNFGNDTLKAVQVRDSLYAKTIPLPAQYIIKSAPAVTGTLLTANTAFNGNSDINLLAGTDNLAPGALDTIRFTINIKTDTVTVFRNSATAFASTQFSTAIVRDTSQTGYNPDPNNDGNPNEMDPTLIVLPSSDLIIPEVFTPNGDGKNDFYVIKGLNGRKVKMTVFNRWGNKVYENPEYDNTWDGFPNVKTMVIGNDKLPQGTYFLILEFQDKDKEVKTGYVVIQY